jgi:shikimate dehydrogenase
MSTPYFEWREAPEADFAVLGDPVSHSRSPAMHAAAYAHFGLTYRYVAIRVAPGELFIALDHLKQLGYRGVNITIPLKAEALAACPNPAEFAVRVESVNTIDLRSGAGINTDGAGFLRTIEPFPGEVLVCGAGGSARAIVGALSESGRSVRLWNRTAARAEQLAREWPRVTAETNLKIRCAAIVVNATAATLGGFDLEIDWEAGSNDLVAYDLMYQPEPGPFLSAAARHGFRTIDGLPMLAAQGALSFRYWLESEIGDSDPYPPMLDLLMEPPI